MVSSRMAAQNQLQQTKSPYSDRLCYRLLSIVIHSGNASSSIEEAEVV